MGIPVVKLLYIILPLLPLHFSLPKHHQSHHRRSFPVNYSSSLTAATRIIMRIFIPILFILYILFIMFGFPTFCCDQSDTSRPPHNHLHLHQMTIILIRSIIIINMNHHHQSPHPLQHQKNREEGMIHFRKTYLGVKFCVAL